MGPDSSRVDPCDSLSIISTKSTTVTHASFNLVLALGRDFWEEGQVSSSDQFGPLYACGIYTRQALATLPRSSSDTWPIELPCVEGQHKCPTASGANINVVISN
jgi:hypothetical protein